MISSVAPRVGLHGPSSPDNADPIHGHEYTIAGNDDLQYACVFDLPTPRDCLEPNNGCDCAPGTTTRSAIRRSIQRRSAPRPTRGRVSSGSSRASAPRASWPRFARSQISDNTQVDYAYRPAVSALIGRVKSRLKL